MIRARSASVLRCALPAIALALFGACGGGSSTGPDGGTDAGTTGTGGLQSSCQIAGSAADNVYCATDGAGVLYCWEARAATPTVIPVGHPIARLNSVDCGVTTASTSVCWGGVAIQPAESAPITGLTEVAGESAATGAPYFCSIIGGEVFCNGDNSAGQLGDGTLNSNGAPFSVKAQGLSDIVQVWTANENPSTCAVSATGALFCWGANGDGQLGVGDNGVHLAPTLVNLPGAKQVAMGVTSACAVTTAGGMYCWGGDASGTTGLNGQSTTVPTATSLSSATAVSMGYGHGCAITSDGSLYCWGGRGEGVCGNQEQCPPTPTKVTGLSGIVSVATSFLSTCAIAHDGSIHCMGDVNGSAQPSPVKLPVQLTGCQ